MGPDGDRGVIVVGAGIAGLALALAMAQQGVQVTVIEAGPPPSALPAEVELGLAQWDPRVSALTPASTGWLDRLGVWRLIESERAGPYRTMAVWDASGTGQITFTADDLDVPFLGHIVENRVTIAALLQAVSRRSNITLLWNEGIETADFSGAEDVAITTTAGRELAASLLVGADGARSRTRELAALKTRDWSYEQHAIVTTIRLASHHQETCFQAFLDTGPLALLPLADPTLCSIVWSLDDGHWEDLMALNDAGFVAALNRALGSGAPAVEAVAARHIFPLRQCHATDYIRPGFALVGDAAHSIHPLAGQGINLGLKDVAVLAEEIGVAWQDGMPLGQEGLLRRYQRRRKTDNLLMMSAMEAFKRGFGSRHPALRIARNMGLNWVDGTLGLKNWFAREALN